MNYRTQNQNASQHKRNGHKTGISRYIVLVLILSFSMFSSTQLCAQINEEFKVDWGLGYGFGGKSKSPEIVILGVKIPGSEATATGRKGVAFHVEPRYGISDRLTFGFRLGADILGPGKIDGEALDINISAVSSYLATGEYNFSTGKVRSFGGLGMGLYEGESLLLESTTAFGVMPRVGVNLGHFRTILAYNLPFNNQLPKYLTFTIGVEFGGGE